MVCVPYAVEALPGGSDSKPRRKGERVDVPLSIYRTKKRHADEPGNGLHALTLNLCEGKIVSKPVVGHAHEHVGSIDEQSPMGPQKKVLVADRERHVCTADDQVALRQAAKRGASLCPRSP